MRQWHLKKSVNVWKQTIIWQLRLLSDVLERDAVREEKTRREKWYVDSWWEGTERKIDRRIEIEREKHWKRDRDSDRERERENIRKIVEGPYRWIDRNREHFII